MTSSGRTMKRFSAQLYERKTGRSTGKRCRELRTCLKWLKDEYYKRCKDITEPCPYEYEIYDQRGSSPRIIDYGYLFRVRELTIKKKNGEDTIGDVFEQ